MKTGGPRLVKVVLRPQIHQPMVGAPPQVNKVALIPPNFTETNHPQLLLNTTGVDSYGLALVVWSKKNTGGSGREREGSFLHASLCRKGAG